MLAQFAPVYAVAAAVICVLALFAKQNRASGWRKPERHSLVETLSALRATWDELDQQTAAATSIARVASEPTPAAREPFSVEAATGFSSQLMNLQTALNATPSVAPSAASSEQKQEAEAEAVQVIQ